MYPYSFEETISRKENGISAYGKGLRLNCESTVAQMPDCEDNRTNLGTTRFCKAEVKQLSLSSPVLATNL